MNVGGASWGSMSLSNNSRSSTTSFTTTSSVTNDTDSTSRTIPGPGALSGKAILALGKATLYGAEVLIIRRRFLVISSKFPHKDEDNIKGIESLYKDVLELSRRDLYSNAIRSRALCIILAQIGSGHVEKLVHSLTSWHNVEFLILLSEMFEMFNPLWLANAVEAGDLPSSIQAYQSSLANFHRHGLEPFVSFLCRLILASEEATRVVFEAGIMNFLVYVYTSGFSDPLAAKAGVANTQLRVACDSLLDATSKSKKGQILFVKDQFHVLWPMRQGSLLFQNIPDRRARRADVWKLANTEIVALRMQSIMNVMTLEDHRGLLDQDSLDDIASDILELSRDNVHHEAMTSFMLNMSLVLIGSRKIKELVYCVSTWPVADIQAFVSKLTYMFNPLRLIVAKVEENLSSLIQTYHQHSIGAEADHSLEPVVTFVHQLAQVSNHVSEAVLQGGTLEFFTHLYIANFFDPLGDDMFPGSPALRAACDGVLHTCSSTLLGLEIISNHQLNVLWPMLVLPASPFVSFVDQYIQRAKVWKEMETEFVLLRMQSIFNMMVKGDHWGLLELDTLDNIAVDMLHFFRDFSDQSPLNAKVTDMISLLIGSGKTEKLIVCLAAWPFADIKTLSFKLTKMFDPLRGMQVLLGLRETRGDSLNAERNCSLESIVIFLERLAHHRKSASQAMLEGGVLDFLLHAYLADFCDPLATDMDLRRSNIRAACGSLLRTFFTTDQGLNLIGEHNICILWPPDMHFVTRISDRPVRRAEIWRAMDSECILLRLGLILRGLNLYLSLTQREYQYYCPTIHPLKDIVTDVLECLGYTHQYPGEIRNAARCIILMLIASGKAEAFVRGLATWPSSPRVMFITDLVETFVSRNLRTLPARDEIGVSVSVQLYYESLTGMDIHPMEPLFTFCNRILQECPEAPMRLFWNTDIPFLLQHYLYYALSENLTEMQPTLQELWDSISTAHSRSKTFQLYRWSGVRHFYSLGRD